jgi:hypothetical protein
MGRPIKGGASHVAGGATPICQSGNTMVGCSCHRSRSLREEVALLDLDQASIVILARNYNPSIVSKEWLLSKGIITESLVNFVHVPAFSMVEGELVQLVLDENRLQLILKQPNRDNLHVLTECASRFVASLPETPYIAVGLNFRLTVPSSRLNLGVLLAPRSRTLRKLFGHDYEVGGRIEFKYNSFRVRVDIPVEGPPGEFALIAFNFHADVKGSSEALERISQHRLALAKAEAVVAGVVPNG